MRALNLTLAILALAACGGGASSTATPALRTTGPTQNATSGPPQTQGAGTDLPTTAELCGLLTAADWGQFNYVTAAQPDMISDAPGSAICTYANGLFLEAYVDETAEDAEATFQTILENVPFDGATSVAIPGTDEVQLDVEIPPDNAGICVRTGRVSFTIGLPAGEAAQAQLTTLAALVLQRLGSIT